MWNGRYFGKAYLHDIDVVVWLGHRGGECPRPRRIDRNFTTVDCNGIHTVSLGFCGCIGAPENYHQLIQFGWFPSTTRSPKTAYTFRLLKMFQHLSLQCKSLSPYHFCQSLERLTDNVDRLHLPVSSFLSTVDLELILSLRKYTEDFNEPIHSSATLEH